MTIGLHGQGYLNPTSNSLTLCLTLLLRLNCCYKPVHASMGTKGPGNFRSPGTKIPENERARVPRNFHSPGTKVPLNFRSSGTKVLHRDHERSWVRKVCNSWRRCVLFINILDSLTAPCLMYNTAMYTVYGRYGKYGRCMVYTDPYSSATAKKKLHACLLRLSWMGTQSAVIY